MRQKYKTIMILYIILFTLITANIIMLGINIHLYNLIK